MEVRRAHATVFDPETGRKLCSCFPKPMECIQVYLCTELVPYSLDYRRDSLFRTKNFTRGVPLFKLRRFAFSLSLSSTACGYGILIYIGYYAGSLIDLAEIF